MTGWVALGGRYPRWSFWQLRRRQAFHRFNEGGICSRQGFQSLKRLSTHLRSVEAVPGSYGGPLRR